MATGHNFCIVYSFQIRGLCACALRPTIKAQPMPLVLQKLRRRARLPYRPIRVPFLDDAESNGELIMDRATDSTDVPEDFPHAPILGAVAGSAPKILLVRRENGTYAAPKISDQERNARWKHCEDLANQFADAALRSKVGKRSDWTEEDILDQYLPRLKKTGWVSNDESIWVLRRSAAILNWPLPLSLQKTEEVGPGQEE